MTGTSDEESSNYSKDEADEYSGKDEGMIVKYEEDLQEEQQLEQEEDTKPVLSKRTRGRPRKANARAGADTNLVVTTKRKRKRNSRYIDGSNSEDEEFTDGRKKPGRKKGQSLDSGKWGWWRRRGKSGRDDWRKGMA